MQVWPQLVYFPQAIRLNSRVKINRRELRKVVDPNSYKRMNQSKTLGKQCHSWFWPAGYAYVAVLVDVAGALAAQLQGDGRQVFGSGLHDHFAHRAVAGVENVIKSLPQKLLSLWDSSGHYRIKLLKQKKTHTIRLNEIFKHLLTVVTLSSFLWVCVPFLLYQYKLAAAPPWPWQCDHRLLRASPQLRYLDRWVRTHSLNQEEPSSQNAQPHVIPGQQHLGLILFGYCLTVLLTK